MKGLTMALLLFLLAAGSGAAVAQERSGGEGSVALCTTNCDGGSYEPKCHWTVEHNVRDGRYYPYTWPAPDGPLTCSQARFHANCLAAKLNGEGGCA